MEGTGTERTGKGYKNTGEKIYRDLNLPNPTIRERFIPKYHLINRDKSQQKTYCFDAPGFLNDGIELMVTNWLGYNNSEERSGEITERELWEHLREMDDKVLGEEMNLAEKKGDCLFNKVADMEEMIYDLYDTTERVVKDLKKDMEKGVYIKLEGLSEKDIKGKDILIKESEGEYRHALLDRGYTIAYYMDELESQKRRYESIIEQQDNKIAKQNKKISRLKKKSSKGLLSKLFG